jgi:hypothetical protein
MDVDNDFFNIPAGSPEQTVTQCATFNSDSLLLSITPHMHYRGKDARFEIQRPGQPIRHDAMRRWERQRLNHNPNPSGYPTPEQPSHTLHSH